MNLVKIADKGTMNLLRIFSGFILLLLPPLIWASCSPEIPGDCYTRGLAFKDVGAFKKGCLAGHGPSCDHAGWNNRKDSNVQNSTPEGVSYFKRGCELDFANSCYNYASYLATNSEPEQATKVLIKAINLGFHNWELIDNDKEIKWIRNRKELKEVILKKKGLNI